MHEGANDDAIGRRAEGAIGKVLRDKWRLDRLLGVGGMAAVYAATHRNGKHAAVKVLHAEAALAPTVKDRFLREGYLANKVAHPGAVSILDDDIDEDGTVFLVMELLEGETLDARLTRSGARLPPAELLLIVDRVLDCLVSAHQKGIVHRDLKPGNLFVTDQGAVKILDFGIARLEEVGQVRAGGTGGQTLGTPGFMPPEQARGRWSEVDAQSDLWAVGAVMFAARAGRRVHEAPTVNEQLLAAMTVPAEPLLTASPDSPAALATLVDRALAFKKEERWASAAEMRVAVRAAYEAIEGKPLADAPRLSVRPPPVAISVSPHDATLDASPEMRSGLQETTTRPVAGGKKALAPASRVWLAAAVVAALVALVAAALLRGAEERAAGAPPPPAAQAAAGPAEPVRPASAQTPPTAPDGSALGRTPGPDPSTAQTPAAAAAKSAPRRAKPAPTPTAPPPATPGASDVDLFSRRR